MGVGVGPLAPPGGEEVEPLLDVQVGRAGLVPGRGGLGGSGTVGVADGEVLQAQGDVEGPLEQLGGGVDLVDDVLSGGLGVVERGRVGAVGCDADQGHLPGVGTAGRPADGRDQIHSGRVAVGDVVQLALAEQVRDRHSPEGVVAAQELADGMVGSHVEVQVVRSTGEVGARIPPSQLGA